MNKKIKELKFTYFDDVYRNVTFIIFIVGLFSLFTYLSVYSFLYGYYFGGEEENYYTNFLYYSNFVSFNPETYSVTTTYFLGMFYLVKSWNEGISVLKQKNKNTLFPLAVLSLLILMLMNLFFVGEVNITGVVSHLLFFAIIFLFIYNIYILILFIYKPNQLIHLISQTCIVLIIIIKIGSLTEEDLVLLSLIIIIIFPLLKKISINKFASFQLYFILIYFLYISNLFPLNRVLGIENLKIAILLIIGMVLTKKYLMVTSFGFYNNKNNGYAIDLESNTTINRIELIEEYRQKGLTRFAFDYLIVIFRDNNNVLAKIIVITISLVVFLTFPQISLLMGKGIRSFSTLDNQKYSIQIIEHNGFQRSEYANYYIIKDGNIYYSNSNWELEVEKIDNYNIRLIK